MSFVYKNIFLLLFLQMPSKISGSWLPGLPDYSNITDSAPTEWVWHDRIRPEPAEPNLWTDRSGRQSGW